VALELARTGMESIVNGDRDKPIQTVIVQKKVQVKDMTEDQFVDALQKIQSAIHIADMSESSELLDWEISKKTGN
jgi:hypothetical protein